MIGLFLLSFIKLSFACIAGEYIGAIDTQVLHPPLIVEKAWMNFSLQSPRRGLWLPFAQ